MSRLAASDGNPRIAQGIGVKAIPAKRLYRGVVDYVRKLENGRQHRRNTMSLFVSEQVTLRLKLRDACEKLLFTYPLEYGKQAEELIWRKVYYEVIQLVKKNKRFEKPNVALSSYYRQLLQSGIGYYHHVLLKLQAYFDFQSELDWPFTVSPLSSRSKRFLFDKIHKNDLEENTKENEENRMQLKEFAQNMCYRFFMCLGDLGRYQLDLGGSRPFAERFYHLALQAKPHAGMPYNQLGTLAGHHQWWGLNAAYYYYKCLETESKFEGADMNLQRLLDRNKKIFYHIPNDALENILSSGEYKREHSRILIVSFLYLCDLLRPKTYATDVEITGLCKKLIDALSACLDGMLCIKNKPQLVNNQIEKIGNMIELNLSSMQPSIIFKMTIICMINIYNLQSSRSNRSSAAIAFALAYLSHLLHFVISAVTDCGKKHALDQQGGGDGVGVTAAEPTPPIQRNEEEGDGDAGNQEFVEKKKSKKSKFPRRRRAGNQDEDLSEGEEHKDVELSNSDDEANSSASSESLSDSTDSDFSQEDIEITDGTSPDQEKTDHEWPKEILNKESSQHVINDNNASENPLEHLKDISQKMFQTTVRRQITLAPTFLNKIKPKTITQTNEASEDVPDADEEVNEEGNTNKDLTKVEENINEDLTPEHEEEQINSDDESDFDQCSDEDKLRYFQLAMELNYIMPSLKLLFDWLAENKQIAEACAQNSIVLWKRIAKLANILPNHILLRTLGDDLINSQADNIRVDGGGEWKQVVKLPEDSVLSQCNVKISDEFCEVAAKHKVLTQTRQMAIRVLSLQSLCHVLCDVTDLNISYNAEKHIFSGPQDDVQEPQLDITAVEEMRKTKLMKDMAALRLKTEVSALEVSAKTHDTNMCLYLVPDTLALCYELHKIKRLVNSKRFFLVIPKVVIDGLDSLKKDLQGARDAARYLETEFKKGNRFLRAQMSDEVVKGVEGERPKLRKNDMQAWRFYRVIECCLYLMEKEKQKNPEQEHSTAGIVAILTRSTDRSVMSLNQINAVSSAQNLGIQLQGASEFTKNWKRA